MSYQNCLEYLEKLGNEVLGMRFGLETIQAVLGALGNPHRSYRSVLVTGTNGKGSVARFLSRICSASGIKTGLYTSPHLVRVEERIAVNDRPVTPRQFATCLTRVIEIINRLQYSPPSTYFETLTAAAFLHFHTAGVELAILEIGMGGRLDSTNVVDPELSILTPIGLDHQQFLGSTLADIAREKAGIIHQSRPVLTVRQADEAAAVIEQIALERRAALTVLEPSRAQHLNPRDGRYSFSFEGQPYRLGVYGEHQVENACLALTAAGILRSRGIHITLEGMRRGVSAMRSPAVLRRLGTRPLIFLDGGHNPDAARSLARFIHRHTPPRRNLVLGMMRDKQIEEFAAILQPFFDQVFVTRVASPRSASLERMSAACPFAIEVPDPKAALDQAKASADIVLVTGSFYLVGEVLKENKVVEKGKVTRFRKADRPR